MSTPTIAGVTDTVSDAWSTSPSAVHDIAATAAEVAATVAVAAVEQLEDLPDRVAGLATAAKGRIRPAPRRSYKPWVLVGAAVATFVVVAWWLRKRSASTPTADYGRAFPDTTTSSGNHATSVAGS